MTVYQSTERNAQGAQYSYECREAETGKLLGWVMMEHPLRGDVPKLYAPSNKLPKDFIAKSLTFSGPGAYEVPGDHIAAPFAWQCFACRENNVMMFEQFGIELQWEWQKEFLAATGRFYPITENKP